MGRRTYIKQHLEENDPELMIDSITGNVDDISVYNDDKIDGVLISHSQFLNALNLTQKIRSATKIPVIIYTLDQVEDISNQIIDVEADAYLALKSSPEEFTLIAKRIKTIVEISRSNAIAKTVSSFGETALIVELEEKIIYFNTSFEKLVSANINQIRGKSITHFLLDVGPAANKLLLEGGEGKVNLLTLKNEVISCMISVINTNISGKKAKVISFFGLGIDNKNEKLFRLIHEYIPKILQKRNIGELVKATLDAIEERFDSEIISFMMVEGEELVCLERRWKKNSIRIRLDGKFLSSRSVQEGQSLVDNDLLIENSNLDDFLIKSQLAVPIKNNDAIVAVLDLRNRKPGTFTKDDVEIIEIISLYVGCALSFISELQLFKNIDSKYFKTLETLNEAVYIISDYHYLYVNRRGVELLGYDQRSELVGKPALLHTSPESLRVLENKLKKTKDDDVDTFNLKLTKRDNSSIETVFRVLIILFEGKHACLLVEKDPLNQKLIQDQIKKYTNYLEIQVEKKNKELVEVQQSIATDKLASMVGHDLRSPLQSIRNATYLVRKQPERSEEMLKTIETSVDRALSMLEDLRYQSMTMSLKIETSDFNNLIMEIIQEAPITEKIVVTTRFDPELKTVDVDSLKMRRVIDNLVRNAIEAMPNGGELTIETKSEGDQCILTVTDTGVGISEENLPNLFKPYYTTKMRGLGLGLAYIKKAVEAHGGKISVESKVGKGTIFKISIKKLFKSEGKETPL